MFNFDNDEKVQKIIFEDEEKAKKNHKESKGIRFLKELGYPTDYTFGEFFAENPALGNFIHSKPMRPVVLRLKLKDDTEVSHVLDVLFKRVKREDFIFTRPYEVASHYEKTRGKWSSVVSNSVYLDSKKFHIVYSDMFFKRFGRIMMQTAADGELTFEQFGGVVMSIELSK